MAEDVCDSWEDLAKTEVLEKQLEQLKINGGDSKGKKSNKTSPESSFASSKDTSPKKTEDGASSSKKSPGVKILKRPEGTNRKSTTGSTSIRTGLNANSEPFVPKTTVELEDSTRTQFKAPLKILKREKPGNYSSSNSSNESGGSRVTKTYEEREAEYKKARERILGSALPPSSPPPSSDFPVQTSPLLPTPVSSTPVYKPPLLATPSTSRSMMSGQMEVPLLRQPQGPSVDGGKGFTRVKR